MERPAPSARGWRSPELGRLTVEEHLPGPSRVGPEGAWKRLREQGSFVEIHEKQPFRPRLPVVHGKEGALGVDGPCLPFQSPDAKRAAFAKAGLVKPEGRRVAARGPLLP